MATEKQLDRMWDILISLDSETLLRAITNYNGLQILDDGFAEFLVDEGLMEPDEEEEEEPEEPGEDDYVISNCSPLGSRTVVSVQTRWADKSKSKVFNTEEEAVKAIKEDMAAQKYRPNVWRQDDHGGHCITFGRLRG
jgi:hypothetical protein